MPEPAVIQAATDSDLAALRQELIADPAAVHARGWMGTTPLHQAASGKSAECVRLLLDAGANPRARRDNGDTPLHRAGTAAIVELLFWAAKEVTPDQHNEFQQTPLHTATDAEVASALLKLRASLTARDHFSGTPLHGAGVGKARVLLDAGAEVDSRDRFGQTPLHGAVRRAETDLVGLLLAAGADPAGRDMHGRSSVHLAQGPAREPARALLTEALRGRSLAEPSTLLDRPRPHPRLGLLRIDGPGRFAYGVAGHAILARWSLTDLSHPESIVPTEHIGFSDIAVHPHQPLVAVAPREAPVELRHRDDFGRTEMVPELTGVAALAFSPDGRWLAADAPAESVVLFDLATRAVVAEVEGGERPGRVAFSPDGTLLASTSVCQGGAEIFLHRVAPDGRLEQQASIDSFADEIPVIEFTPDGDLMIWEIPAGHPRRGDLSVISSADGSLRWRRTVDATSRNRPTPPCVTSDGTAIAVGLDDTVTLFNAGDGTTHAILPLPAAADAIGVDHVTGLLVVATAEGLQRPPASGWRRPPSCAARNAADI